MITAKSLLSACSITQSIRSKKFVSIVYGEDVRVWADHFIGILTELKPAFFIAVKYSALRKSPQSPSFGASRALPKFIPLPNLIFCSKGSVISGIVSSGSKGLFEFSEQEVTNKRANKNIRLLILNNKRVLFRNIWVIKYYYH